VTPCRQPPKPESMCQRGRTLNIEKPGADHIVSVIP